MKKIALVTGGTRGIGAGISKALRENGYLVAANYHKDHEAAEKYHNETGIPVFSWDVSDYESCQKGVEKVYEELGGTVDVLVNNAGITRDSMLHKMDPAAWNIVIATNLTSVFNMCRLIVPTMRDKKFGRIINISSVNGVKGQVGQANYSAAKAGILGFTKALAQEIDLIFKNTNPPRRMIQGMESGFWILLDYGDIVVHVFAENGREMPKRRGLRPVAFSKKEDEDEDNIPNTKKPLLIRSIAVLIPRNEVTPVIIATFFIY